MRIFRKLTVLCALFLVVLCFGSVAVHAEKTTTTTSAPVTTTTNKDADKNEIEVPNGTGTIIDVFSGEDGKKMYTISTPAGNVFYLIVDLTRYSENVYFLDAVTEKDLLALAEASDSEVQGDSIYAVPDTDSEANVSFVTEPDTSSPSDPEPDEKSNSNTFSMILVVLIAVVGGGAGFYFKIYRPKHSSRNLDEYEDEFESEFDSGEEYEAESEDDDA